MLDVLVQVEIKEYPVRKERLVSKDLLVLMDKMVPMVKMDWMVPMVKMEQTGLTESMAQMDKMGLMRKELLSTFLKRIYMESV